MAQMNAVTDAVNRVGGSALVAEKLGIAPFYVKKWMEAGTMKDAKYRHVKWLSDMSGTSPEDLAPLD
jgi:hypothetical protein